MATKKSTVQKVNFSKFFPEDNAFVKLSGTFDPKDLLDFEFDFTIQSDLRDFATIYSYFNPNSEGTKQSLAQLKAIQEASAKAIEFIESAQAAAKAKKKEEPIVVAPRVTKQRK